MIHSLKGNIKSAMNTLTLMLNLDEVDFSKGATGT